MIGGSAGFKSPFAGLSVNNHYFKFYTKGKI